MNKVTAGNDRWKFFLRLMVRESQNNRFRVLYSQLICGEPADVNLLSQQVVPGVLLQFGTRSGKKYIAYTTN